MESISGLLLIANLLLSGSVYGFPLHKDTEQTCGYEVGFSVCFIFDGRVLYWRTYEEMCPRFQSGRFDCASFVQM